MALINDFLSLIYPRSCEACKRPLFSQEQHLCKYCQLNLPKSNFHLQSENELRFLLQGRVPVQEASSYYLYEKSGKVQSLIHALKYEGQQHLGEYLGEAFGNDLSEAGAFNHIDSIVPIPLHINKLKHRGYNQSECFAKGVSKCLQKPIDTLFLKRDTETATQTKKKKYQRWENVEGIFTVENPERYEHKHVLLIDDVITTGATIEAAWQAIKTIEGIQVSVLSLAFAARVLS